MRPLYICLLVIAILTIIRFALPTPPDRIRSSETTDADLVTLIKGARVAPNQEPFSEAVTEFGSILFNDNDFLPYQPGRQGRNESCSGCHQHDSTSTTFLTSDRRAPDLRQSRFYQAFGVDGRSETLEDFIASHIEFRTELASNRVRIVRLILEKYRVPYEKAFGAAPLASVAGLPENGMPGLDRREFPVPVSSFILETLADRRQITSILNQAQQDHLAPAVIVSRNILTPLLPGNTDTENYQKLPVELQTQINIFFTNTVKALSEYLRAQPIYQSAFDRYVEKIAAGTGLDESLVPEFNSEELVGLRLFHGPAGCSRCHNGPGFTDNKFHNIGLPMAGFADAGRATGLTLRNKKDVCLPPSPEPIDTLCLPNGPTPDMIKEAIGAFRTPALRGFYPGGKLTHNGQIEGIEEMLEFYSQLNEHPAIGVRSENLTALRLTKEEMSALAAFLRSLGTLGPREQFVIGKK